MLYYFETYGGFHRWKRSEEFRVHLASLPGPRWNQAPTLLISPAVPRRF